MVERDFEALTENKSLLIFLIFNCLDKTEGVIFANRQRMVASDFQARKALERVKEEVSKILFSMFSKTMRFEVEILMQDVVSSQNVDVSRLVNVIKYKIWSYLVISLLARRP